MAAIQVSVISATGWSPSKNPKPALRPDNPDQTRISAAKEQAANIRVLQQIIACTGNRGFPRHQHITKIGKSQTLFGILLNHDDGLAILALQIVQNFEHHVDKARLKTN